MLVFRYYIFIRIPTDSRFTFYIKSLLHKASLLLILEKPRSPFHHESHSLDWSKSKNAFFGISVKVVTQLALFTLHVIPLRARIYLDISPNKTTKKKHKNKETFYYTPSPTQDSWGVLYEVRQLWGFYS